MVYVSPAFEKVGLLTGIAGIAYTYTGIDIGYFEQMILFVLFLIFFIFHMRINARIQYRVTSSVLILLQVYVFRDEALE